MSGNKFMTWSLKRPGTGAFSQYKQLAPGEPWYSKNFVDGTGKSIDGTKTFPPNEAPEKSPDWSAGSTGFIRMIEKYHEKIDAIGQHEFFVNADGTITYGTSLNGAPILNADESDLNEDAVVALPLRYLMHTYPNIRWSLQFLCTTVERVEPMLDNQTSQDTFVRQANLIIQYYKKKYGFPISDCEIDFEKTTTRDGDADKYAALLSRIKNDVCIPNEVGLRINIFAMTGDFTPSYYGYTDYATLAKAEDMNGNQAVDEFQLMTYDYSWGGSAPGPSTPLDWLEKVLMHVKAVSDRGLWNTQDVYIGNAGYGRRWPLHNTEYGVTLDYKMLMQVQNGQYVHNEAEDDTTWRFNDQDFIPFVGFNDEASDYQTTYLHTYDFFKTSQIPEPNFDNVNIGDDSGIYYTNYSSEQTPIFTGATLAITPTISGAHSSQGSNADPIVCEGIPIIPADSMTFYRPDTKSYTYDPSTNSCVVVADDYGNPIPDGSLSYSFSGITSGTKHVVAIICFPFFDKKKIDINVAGTPYTISGDEDWYPYVVNPFCHFFDCGTFDIPSSGTISVELGSTAFVGGFIICDTVDMNIRGGTVTYNSTIKRMKKRGNKITDNIPKDGDGYSEIIDAQWPSAFMTTLECLRRPPRPSIIWEDMFGPHLNGRDIFEGETNIASDTFQYYYSSQRMNYTNGTTPYTDGTKTYCVESTNPKFPVGYSQGKWVVYAEDSELNPDDSAHTYVDSRDLSAQLVLPHKFTSNMQIEVYVAAEDKGMYGVRFLADKPGTVGNGYLFILDYQKEQLRLVREIDGVGTDVTEAKPMSDTLKTLNGDKFVIRVQIIEGKVTCQIGDQTYFKNITLPYVPSDGGAMGVYANACRLRCYRLTLASLDRWEQLERMMVEVDGNRYPIWGEVPRNVGKDENGLLIFTGVPGVIKPAVDDIPDGSDGTGLQNTPNRVGTIFSTETVAEPWSQDFKNLPIQTIPGLTEGKHEIKIHMMDPGIWVRTLYVGDAEGYSVAYNSDKIGFIRTSQMVRSYGCKGIAMWTLGQEDPQVFEYLRVAQE